MRNSASPAEPSSSGLAAGSARTMVNPHLDAPVRIAHDSEDGPRLPRMPGCGSAGPRARMTSVPVLAQGRPAAPGACWRIWCRATRCGTPRVPPSPADPQPQLSAASTPPGCAGRHSADVPSSTPRFGHRSTGGVLRRSALNRATLKQAARPSRSRIALPTAMSRSYPDTTSRHGTKDLSSQVRVSSPVGVEGHHCAVPDITAG